ncbi:hypothetical protein Ancab_036891 [Ancistrocladus abbreviatus]
MAEPGFKSALKKPPGYKDPHTPSTGQNTPKRSRKPLPPSFYHTQKNRRSCCRLCCCCICFLILFLIILLAIAGGLFYLWFTPKLPVFRMRPLELERFNITTKKDGPAFLDSDITIRVEVRNPNEKLTIYYGDTKISLVADGETDLGSATVGGFTQGKKNVTVLKFRTQTEKKQIDGSTADNLSSGVKSQSVKIDAEGKTKVGIGVGSLKIGMLGVNVKCGDKSLKQLNDGDSPKCTINTLKWINIH